MPAPPVSSGSEKTTVNRLGYGAMRLTGPAIWGAPSEGGAALATLRRLPEIGVNFIDTAAAAKLLLDQTWSGVGSIPVLGPEDLSYNDIARIMSEVLGKPVRFHEIPGEAFKDS
jgi:uncharacterized protein YbjT (DUF2867 family)